MPGLLKRFHDKPVIHGCRCGDTWNCRSCWCRDKNAKNKARRLSQSDAELDRRALARWNPEWDRVPAADLTAPWTPPDWSSVDPYSFALRDELKYSQWVSNGGRREFDWSRI
jgi:hypothetical protein